MARVAPGLAMVLTLLTLGPGTLHAGAMLNEHECLGRDTAFDKAGGDAGCTPIGSEIFPPGGSGNTYDAGDVDESLDERFIHRGALEVHPLPSHMWQTIPTVKEPSFRQVGFAATFTYQMMLKSSSMLSDLEVSCSACAERPQSLGPGQTASDFLDRVMNYSDISAQLNLVQEPWTLEASHTCSGANPLAGPGCGGRLMARTQPGLVATFDAQVIFMGCKPTVVRFENRGQFFRGDLVNVTVGVPAASRVNGTFDVSSCEVSYIRGCLPGEGQFKELCVGEP